MNHKKRKKISPAAYKKRSYRQVIATPAGLVSNYITVKETDLHILAAGNIEADGYHLVHRYRNQLENYIGAHREFRVIGGKKGGNKEEWTTGQQPGN